MVSPWINPPPLRFLSLSVIIAISDELDELSFVKLELVRSFVETQVFMLPTYSTLARVN